MQHFSTIIYTSLTTWHSIYFEWKNSSNCVFFSYLLSISLNCLVFFFSILQDAIWNGFLNGSPWFSTFQNDGWMQFNPIYLYEFSVLSLSISLCLTLSSCCCHFEWMTLFASLNAMMWFNIVFIFQKNANDFMIFT